MGSKNLFLKKIFKNLKKLNEIDVLANFHKNICIFHNLGAFSIFLILLRHIPRNCQISMGGSAKEAVKFQIQ